MTETDLAADDAALAERIARECGTAEGDGDFEIEHERADSIIISKLRDLGYSKTADAWESVGKWYA
jgi:hypothetical protein